MTRELTERELTGPPNMAALYAKAGLPMLPGASALPGRLPGGGGEHLPRVALVLPDVDVGVEHLAAYNRVCGFRLSDELPATYPHVLAFPLHMALMTDGNFPFSPVGLVHIDNTITQHRPVRLADRLTVHVHAADLRPHPKGRAFSLVTDVRVGQELVWEEESTMLHREPGDERAGGGQADTYDIPRDDESLPVSAEWNVPADAGRRYAAVSGDRNPIHLHPLTARLFGFPRPIAHGMWTTARCLAFLEGRLPGTFSVSVRFRSPLMLPSRVEVASDTSGAAVRCRLQHTRTGKPHLLGSVQPR